MNDDVSDREKEFFKTLIHFQTQGLQIFEQKQSYIQQLKRQVKSQEEVRRALEEAHKKEASLQQQVHEAEQVIEQVIEQHQKEIEARDEELQKVKEHNAKLIRDNRDKGYNK